MSVSLAANPAVTSLQWRKHVSSNVYTDLDVTTSKYSGGTVSSPDLQINSLSSSDVGNYVVVATNSLGSSQSVDITVDVSCELCVCVCVCVCVCMCARPYMLACVCNRERTCGCTGTLLCLYTVSAPSKSNPSI